MNNSTSVVASPQSSVVRYLTQPQFSSFFGFGDEKGKGVAYRVWWFEVESAIQENLTSHEVIAEQIRKSLQGEAKTKIVGFGLRMSVERILEQLNQFYANEGVAVGVELLSCGYSFQQQEGEEVSAFASCLDNQIWQAKDHGAELLPNEKAVDQHLRLLLWQGLKESVKDKARHKKESCKTFVKLNRAARHGEKEANLTQFPQRVVCQKFISKTGLMEMHEPPKWLPQVCSAMAREV